ncbi:hypothetical protein Gogos_005060, partial [Gossypium gossypioides]|nr:hypothetical protein [Gossypium gossypioides]
YESPYDSYGYAYGVDSYNQGLVGSNSTYDPYSSYSYQDRGMYCEEFNKDHYLTTQVGTLEDAMTACHKSMKTRKNQLDLLLEVVQRQANEHIPVEECVETSNSKLEKELPYISVEHDLKADFQQEIEIRELGEVLGIIKEIFNPINICLEEPPHLSEIMDEIP